jgi:hypothetical protein
MSVEVVQCQEHTENNEHIRIAVLTCGQRTPGGPRLFRKLNNFSQQINKVYIRKKAKSEI